MTIETYTSLDTLKETTLTSLDMTQKCLDNLFESESVKYEIIESETKRLAGLKYIIKTLNIIDTFESPTEYKYKKGDAGRIGLYPIKLSPFTYSFQDLKRKNRKAHLKYHIKCFTLIINALNITNLYQQVVVDYIKLNDNYKAALMSL